MKIESAILAGGKNSRYGGMNKAFIVVDGQQILDRNISVLGTTFSRISIITNHTEQFSAYSNYPMSSDYFHEVGPLAGIHSALKNAVTEGVFISSCDMPFLDKNIIDSILSLAVTKNAEAVTPRINGKLEPLFAFYNVGVLALLEQHIKENKDKSIRSFLKKVNTIYIDIDDTVFNRKAFTNINHPKDLEELNY
ncbi:MAG: molybdenum cofactor guanylyltransferase [Bacteroidales bacterium]|nr:molybdenum cofactor guanylyltransferase [Bacteroidales bacterium]